MHSQLIVQSSFKLVVGSGVFFFYVSSSIRPSSSRTSQKEFRKGGESFNSSFVERQTNFNKLKCVEIVLSKCERILTGVGLNLTYFEIHRAIRCALRAVQKKKASGPPRRRLRRAPPRRRRAPEPPLGIIL